MSFFHEATDTARYVKYKNQDCDVLHSLDKLTGNYVGYLGEMIYAALFKSLPSLGG